jgi:shikimate dehydrogenase
VRRLYFVGVSTSRSSIMTIFPAWAAALGLDAEIRGIDLPLDAPADRLRGVLEEMAADSAAAGALITTHKARMFDSAADRFSGLDTWARLCREVSCVAVRGRSLLGWAKDPITSRQAYTHLLGDDPWATGDTDVVCIGAGGAGLALTVAVLGEDRQPARYVLVDKDPRRLDVARAALAPLDVRAEVDFVVADGAQAADRLVSAASPGALVVNATGMGKDIPGSPVSEAVRFPHGAVAWDMNYRGDLRFLEIARSQAEHDGLLVSDGWRYFLHGWTEVIAEIFEEPIEGETFAELAGIAERLTGRSAPSPDATAGFSRG